jgi:hypothetical protein
LAQKSSARKLNPCAAQVEKITNALEAANYNIRPLYRYVKELEECYDRQDALQVNKKGKASTLYYLSQYLDRQKCKTK